MKRKEFLTLLSAPLLLPACTRWNEEELYREVLLQADLTTELLTVGSYKHNTTIGLFVQRIGTGKTPQDFLCFWTICTHAKCFVHYRPQEERFACPCHGSVFNKQGGVVQGPAAAALETKSVVVSGNVLMVYA